MTTTTVNLGCYYISPAGDTLIILGGKKVSLRELNDVCKTAGISTKEYMDTITVRCSYWQFKELWRAYNH